MTKSSPSSSVLRELHRRGNYAELCALCRAKVDYLAARHGRNHVRVGFALQQLAFAYYEMENLIAAEEVLCEAMEIHKNWSGTASKSYTTCLANLARLYILQGKLKQAEECLDQSLDLQLRLPLEEREAYVATLVNWAKLHLRRDHADKAEQMLDQAKATLFEQKGENHRNYAIVLHHLCDVYWKQDRIEDAERTIRRAIEVFRAVRDVESADYAMALSFLGLVREKNRDPAEALKCHTSALDVLKRALPLNHRNIEELKQRIARVVGEEE